jgi:hypothetical protein
MRLEGIVSQRTRTLNVTPIIAQNISGRRSAVDARTTRHAGYAVSQRKRKRIEEPFGWGKTMGGLARPMLRGVKKLGFKFTLTMAGYNLIRLPKLIAALLRYKRACYSLIVRTTVEVGRPSLAGPFTCFIIASS